MHDPNKDTELNKAIEENMEGPLDPQKEKDFKKLLKKVLRHRQRIGHYVFVSADWRINKLGLPEKVGENKTARRIRDENGKKTKEHPYYVECPNFGANMRMAGD